MGTVHAKEPEWTGSMQDSQPGTERELSFEKIPVKVCRIVVDGLGRTKNDIIVNEVQPIFEANNFQDMVRISHDVKTRFERLGLFKNISISIDTCKDVKKVGYEVTFGVHELRPVSGGINTLIGYNDASLLFGLRLPNLFGRGERVQGDYTHGTKQSRGYHLTFNKPLNGNPDMVFGTTIYQNHGEYPWSGYKETDRGVALDITFPTIFGSHSIKWEGVWRDLRALSRTTSFAVREQAGHSIKSSVQHLFVRDKRDDPILPSRGSLLKLTQEYAGLGGNVQFAKQDVEYQFNQSLAWDTVLQVSLAGGILKSLDPKHEVKVNDRFFLGGPLTLRGFSLKGVGPHSDGNALGADAYWLAALHMYTPLPFRPGKGGFGELFRTHFFINAGNIGNISLNSDIRENFCHMAETFRWAYGGGIVLRMGRVARMELNYVIPMQAQRGDSINAGLQFGIGLTFL
ncbi:sorting and assembly machinery component 50 homolog [Haliotis rufescens]|uniref:sorting and assembly machinery component 50 homolog n=1 Tax=Haliotis rufescens TaxID=6454 RepID=UPI00201E93ED|nr:sorting and assembly machinery component 50 homolog [Haliotis rufescens]